jgi:hypothetical protein
MKIKSKNKANKSKEARKMDPNYQHLEETPENDQEELLQDSGRNPNPPWT